MKYMTRHIHVHVLGLIFLGVLDAWYNDEYCVGIRPAGGGLLDYLVVGTGVHNLVSETPSNLISLLPRKLETSYM